jgi:hypothetical protein
MTVYDGERIKVGQLRRGIDQAVGRFQAANVAEERDTAFFALFEALNWAVALDDVIGDTWRPTGAREGYGWRARVEGGAAMDGVRFVRNRVHHHWADALRLRSGQNGSQYDLWMWRSASDLPSGRPDDRGRKVYSTLMADRSAADTLDELSLAFERVLLFLEPPQPRLLASSP